MSTSSLGAEPFRPAARATGPSTVSILKTAFFFLVLLVITQHVIDGGYVRYDIAALQTGGAWRTGGWLTQGVMHLVALLPNAALQQTTLSILASLVFGAALSILHSRLRQSGWTIFGAALVLLTVAFHAATIYTLTAESGRIPVVIVLAVLVLATRSIEAVGDVQSTIGFGLLLPLLFLAGPSTALLVPPLALAAALSNPDARKSPLAFLALLLVALIPTFITGFGVALFLARAGFELGDLFSPYLGAYSTLRLGDVVRSLQALVMFAPVMVVPLIYVLRPAPAGERHLVSALAVVVFPLYLALSRVVLNISMLPILPPLVLIAMFVVWLAVQPLSRGMRVLSLGLLVLSTLLSWTSVGLWVDPVWRAAVLSVQDIAGVLHLPG